MLLCCIFVRTSYPAAAEICYCTGASGQTNQSDKDFENKGFTFGSYYVQGGEGYCGKNCHPMTQLQMKDLSMQA